MSEAYKKQEGGDHYKGFAIQPGEYCHKNGLKNYESYAVKYITRYPIKWKDNPTKQLEDVDKAIHCLELLKVELKEQFAKDKFSKEISISGNSTGGLILPKENIVLYKEVVGVRDCIEEQDVDISQLTEYEQRDVLTSECKGRVDGR